MAISAAVVNEYVDCLRTARAEVDQLHGLEREIGLAALREEAVRTLRQASTTAVGITGQLQPLREYTDDLVGGERIDKSLQALDRGATKAASSAVAAAATWAWAGTAPAWVLSAFGLFVGILGFAFDSGRALGAALVVGAIPSVFLARTVQMSPRALEGLGSLWSDASRIGRVSEAVFAKGVNSASREIWTLSGGRAYEPQQLTTRARVRAQTIVAIALSVLGVVAGIFLAGAYSALST